MSEGGISARVVEVFPMLLGNEMLVDLTLDAEPGVTPPKPDDTVVLSLPGGEAKVKLKTRSRMVRHMARLPEWLEARPPWTRNWVHSDGTVALV